jgi:hypothetical protein
MKVRRRLLLRIAWLLPVALAAAAPAATTTQPVDLFVRRLLAGRSTQTDALARMLAAMDAAGTGLSQRRDPGRATQDAQKQAVAAIDELIETARRAQNEAAGASKQTSARRRAAPIDPKGRRPRPGESRAQAAGTQPAIGPDRSDRAGVSAAVGEQARRWGHLPSRDRAELLQGLDEKVPPKYREHVERYYRSLSEETPP